MYRIKITQNMRNHAILVHMRQPSGDLFPTDRPIPASQMIGRRDDVRELATALEQGTNLVVVGPRRTGKTSVCEAALTRVKGRGFYVAGVDLFRLADAAELAEALAAAVLDNRSGTRRALMKARQLGRAALSAAQTSAVLKMRDQLGDGVELVLTPGLAQRDPEAALTAALELPERIARADDKRIVVFFDEFQEVAGERRPYGDPDAVTKRMRAIFQRSDHVSHLFAGSLEHVMRDLFAPTRRAFSGYGTFKALRPIGPGEWREGLADRFQADDCKPAPGAIERIVELGEGHPRVTMLIAQQTHLVSVLLGTREIELSTVEQGYRAALEGDEAALEETVGRIRSLHKRALLMARRVATGSALHTGLRSGEGDRALKALRAAGIVEHEGHGDWRIVSPLLRRYLIESQPFA
jgi:hypothetical protein